MSGGSLFSSASYSQRSGSGSINLTGDIKIKGALVGASHTLSVTFAMGLITLQTITARTKTIYSVDSYDGNAASLCLVSDSPIEKADGTMVEIGDLSEGDELKGFSLRIIGNFILIGLNNW